MNRLLLVFEVTNCDLKFGVAHEQNCNHPLQESQFKDFGSPQPEVILDTDLADLYGVTVKRLNEQLKRNLQALSARFSFHPHSRGIPKLEVAKCDLKVWPMAVVAICRTPSPNTAHHGRDGLKLEGAPSK